MWDKPQHRRIEGTARPLRVAYLVDLGDCPDSLLDEVFSECFSRWGGRRTPIVPATEKGVEEAYKSWLEIFDADIIYSFVDLSPAAVSKIHEEYAPGILHKHENRSYDRNSDKRFKVELPVNGLSSLSVLPIFASRQWGIGDKPKEILTFDKFWDSSDSPFLRENFGFLSDSFSNLRLGDSAAELFTCMTLISQGSLENKQLGKSTYAAYEVDENEFLKALSEPKVIIPPSHLSEMFCHYLEPRNSLENKGVNIVVGDSLEDRLLYWNGHHRYPRNELSAISSLRISIDQAKNDEFLQLVGGMMQRRGVRGDNNAPVATIRSVSLCEDGLQNIAERIKPNDKQWQRFVHEKIEGAEWAIPTVWEGRSFFTTGTVSREPKGKQHTELSDGRAGFPIALPWHLSEASLPPSVRGGQWMVDLAIDREEDHCRFSNVVHQWVFPRRLRIDGTFTIERENSSSEMYPQYCQRPIKSGLLSASLELSIRQASISVPSDENALFGGLRNLSGTHAFGSDGQTGYGYPDAPQIRDVRYSDKGRYLRGTLQLFSDLPEAFNILMHDFWRKTLHLLGADPSHLNDDLESKFSKTMARRLGANNGEWEVTNDLGRQKVVREALKIASQLKRPSRFVTYSDLLIRFTNLKEGFLNSNPHIEKQSIDEDSLLSTELLDRSIQLLCSRQVLFQGREWRCHSCYNRNWVSIGELGPNLTCAVCRHETAAPVSGDWQFKANPFLVEAYSDHGTEAALWALWKLSELARSSFYFLTSSLLWFDKDREDGQNDCEIDLLAVVDGKVYGVEATTSKSLTKSEINKLVDFSGRVRPDVLLIVCGAETPQKRSALKAKIQENISTGVSVEIWTYIRNSTDIDPYLPD